MVKVMVRGVSSLLSLGMCLLFFFEHSVWHSSCWSIVIEVCACISLAVVLLECRPYFEEGARRWGLLSGGPTRDSYLLAESGRDHVGEI